MPHHNFVSKYIFIMPVLKFVKNKLLKTFKFLIYCLKKKIYIYTKYKTEK